MSMLKFDEERVRLVGDCIKKAASFCGKHMAEILWAFTLILGSLTFYFQYIRKP